jgi:uncharacterized protein YkwD
MRFAQRHDRVFIAITGAFVALLLFALGPSASAEASACSKYGNKGPAQLTKKHARAAVTCLINRERGGRRNLHQDGRLIEAARKHSGRMAKSGCFSHTCPGESGLQGRLERVRYIINGLSRWAYGENIAWGRRSAGTPRRVVNSWMHSSGHRANILSNDFRDIGVGFHNRGSKGYYTADFGLRRG